MSVLVRKSSPVLVRPSEPVSMSSTTIKLSPLDKGQDFPVSALLMFEHPIHEVANTMMRALSKALVYYFPIAGRILAGAEVDEVHIHCNNEGVVFVSASANCALKEVMLLDRSHGTRTLLDELATVYPAKGFCPTDPLLLVQVTEFTCGGFVLGVTWNHAIADGAGMAQFLQAIGELVRGLSSPSIVPVRWDNALRIPPPIISQPEQQTMTNLDPFDDPLTNRIKAEFNNRFSGQTCTTFEAASAVLWQCRTRAIMSNPETPALFLFLANVRNHVGARQGYYGNCATVQVVMAKSSTVAKGGILDLVKMIKDSKEKIADQLKKYEGSKPQQAVAVQTQQLREFRYNILIVSSWVNLGFDDADFGSGRPARVTCYRKDKPSVPECTVCLPWKAKNDGLNVLSAVVKEEHVGAFLGELARLT
ncbi:hypothetical protein GQ55_8G180100 [Panicum hallii var. hallii]|uniref:Uncharacterized protein n=1 Tax=Panicum hallii var. hallii TaxID=1504633 RepID=A0A2T7CNL8_9POAL|nr:hypothetical protein GQ55_8G180100 [Panicum hallii var. hallii]